MNKFLHGDAVLTAIQASTLTHDQMDIAEAIVSQASHETYGFEEDGKSYTTSIDDFDWDLACLMDQVYEAENEGGFPQYSQQDWMGLGVLKFHQSYTEHACRMLSMGQEAEPMEEYYHDQRKESMRGHVAKVRDLRFQIKDLQALEKGFCSDIKSYAKDYEEYEIAGDGCVCKVQSVPTKKTDWEAVARSMAQSTGILVSEFDQKVQLHTTVQIVTKLVIK